jgi:hypothetical protein
LVLCCCFMGSIVYGDIIPFTVAEESLTLCYMILGRVFIAFLFAEIASYVSSLYSNYNNHMVHKNKVMKWMSLNNIQPTLRKRVEKYFKFKWYNQKGIEEQELMKELPNSLRKNVKNYIFDELI